jgi:hypothetical protein
LLRLTVESTNNDKIKFKEVEFGPGDIIISNSTLQRIYFSTIKTNKTGV